MNNVILEFCNLLKQEVLYSVYLRDLIHSYKLFLELVHSDLANEDELFRMYCFLMLLEKVLAPLFLY